MIMIIDEDNVKKYLSFLIEKYGMYYAREDYNAWDNWAYATYSFYNDSGCFTITDLVQGDDVDYAVLDSVNSLKTYVFSDSSEQSKSQMRIASFEKDIWEKYEKGFLFFKNLKKPFFWRSAKNILQTLAEVIETQIQKTGQFFGIKVET